MQCLMRGFAGNPVVDIDGDGHVDLDELASYTARYMAFAAEGKPMFKTTGDFSSKLRLASGTKPKGPHAGDLLEAKSRNKMVEGRGSGCERRPNSKSISRKILGPQMIYGLNNNRFALLNLSVLLSAPLSKS